MHNLRILLDEIGEVDQIDDEKFDQIKKLNAEFKIRLKARVPDTHQDYFGTLHNAFEKSLFSFQTSQILDVLSKVKALSLAEEEGSIVKEFVRLSAAMEGGSIIGQSEADGPNSENWHFAKIVTLYLLDLRLADEEGWRCAEIGYKIGFLFRDQWWKANHEQAAIGYYSNLKAAREASQKGGNTTSSIFSELRERVLHLIPTAIAEKGLDFVYADLKIRATTLREIALRDASDEFVGPQNKPLSIDWFLRTLEDFQASGRLHEALSKAQKSINM